MAKAFERSTIEKAIEKFSFNSGDRDSPQHRWSYRQPIIDYHFDENSGVWTYTATIPGPGDPEDWKDIDSEIGEDLETFLTRVKKRPHQLKLGV